MRIAAAVVAALTLATATAVDAEVVSPAAAASPAARAKLAAPGGVGILAAAPHARAVVTGTIARPEQVDRHGWRASLVLDRVLRGEVRLGDTITIAWEELSTGRRVRFDDGDRVLVVLDPLPTQSLWRKRFPAGGVLVIAANGDAFLRAPDGATVGALEHFLALAADARAGAPGARELAELVRTAQPGVAREALALLASDTRRIETLGDDGAASLLDTARDSTRDPALRAAALRLAAEHRLPGTRVAAHTLARPGSAIRADAYRALAALPDGLERREADALLDDPASELRVVGVELARDAALRPRVVRLAREDPSATVRLAAGQALLARGGAAAIADVIPLLDDRDNDVRRGAAEAIGVLGRVAVDPLQAVVEKGSENAALAAVVGLARAGTDGGMALRAIAADHPNEHVRAFARLALGKAPSHDVH